MNKDDRSQEENILESNKAGESSISEDGFFFNIHILKQIKDKSKQTIQQWIDFANVSWKSNKKQRLLKVNKPTIENLLLKKSEINKSLNLCDEAWWFLSLRVFRLFSSSLLLFRERFGQYVPGLLQVFVELCNLPGTSS